MRPQRTRPRKTAVVVAQRIVSDINRSAKEPGDHLAPEREMLEEYQVSRGTLRESLRFLELQGVLTLKPGPGGGPIVSRPDSSSLETTLTLLLQFEKAPYSAIAESRMGIEPLLAQLSATRMGSDLRSELTESVESMRAGIHDQQVFFETNKQFHSVIAEGSDNPLLNRTIEALLNLLDGSAIGVDYPERRRRAVLRAHQAILDAILAEDPQAAEAAMRGHIEEYFRYLTRTHPHTLQRPIMWQDF